MRSVIAGRIEEGIKRATEITTPTVGSSTVVGSAMGWLNEYGIAIGVILTVVSLAMNWYYREKSDRRHEREHQLRIKDVQTRKD